MINSDTRSIIYALVYPWFQIFQLFARTFQGFCVALRYNLGEFMKFIFSRRFFVLLAFGIVPLSLSWTLPELRYAVLAYDIVLIVAAVVDVFISRKLPAE